VIFLPHGLNKDLATFTHITTLSGKDIKMTPLHVIPSGVCGVYPLPLLYANQGTNFENVFLVTDSKQLRISVISVHFIIIILSSYYIVL
jgi:hypothetical protein